ncbi:unnamed protein product [Ectocarpus sp. CCAP 1310/34]|nr:unnamed protein product [Ectocarpus sp. CCAP 1310/34]
MFAAGALCCFVASAFLQGQSFECPARHLDSIGLSASEWGRGFKRSGFRNCISIVTPAAHHNRGGADLEMSSTTATSVWATCGEPEVRRCPAGGPLSSPQEFLLANPPGPYTCLRTVDHRSVAMLPFHLDRLWHSSQATGFGPAARAQGRQSLEQGTVETIARVTESFRQGIYIVEKTENAGGGCPECMTTVLYTHRRRPGKEDVGEGLSDDDQPEGATAFTGARTSESPRKEAARRTKNSKICIMAHAWPLPTPPVDGRPAGVKVLIAGSGRSCPEAKHSSWLRDRKRLDELKAQTRRPVLKLISRDVFVRLAVSAVTFVHYVCLAVGAQEVVLSEIGFSPEGTTRRLLLEGMKRSSQAWTLPTFPEPKVILHPRCSPGLQRALPTDSALTSSSPLLRDVVRRTDQYSPTIANPKVLERLPALNTTPPHKSGLTSNFFVVEEDGAVCTAPSGVLLGGMRQLLISVCDKEGIEVRLDAPDISRAGRWREAFLTGTGRVVAPVSTLIVPEIEDSSKITRGSGAEVALSKIGIPCPPGNIATVGGKPVPSLAETLRSRVVAELGEAATQIF